MSSGDIISVAGIGIVLLGILSRLAMGRIGAVDKRVSETNTRIDDAEKMKDQTEKDARIENDNLEKDLRREREELERHTRVERDKIVKDFTDFKLHIATFYISKTDARANEESLKKDIDQRIGSLERHVDGRFDTLTVLINKALDKRTHGGGNG